MRADHSIVILQGDFRVSSDPHLYFTTILGSCVSACIRDPIMGIGGMNHFLLPGAESGDNKAEQYGVHLMELLVNGLLKSGAQKQNLEAKLFGGARVVQGLSDIGARNADFAEKFLRNEGIPIVGGSLRGNHPRRIHFWPVSGRARQLLLPMNDMPSVKQTPAPTPAIAANAGDLELF